MIYFDACYAAKLYTEEPDSDRVKARGLAERVVACAAHGQVEVFAVFHRKLREGLVTTAELQLACDQFDSDCASGLWAWFPVGSALISATMKRLRTLPPHLFVRAADAMHMTCAAEEGFKEIHTSDRHMIAAAPAFGLKAITL